jgi:hypothetical protein
MKKLALILFSLLMITGTSACSPEESPLNTETPEQPEQPDDNENPDENKDTMKLRITIGSTAFIATFVDNATAIAFKTMLPMTVNMSELNGNEKYCGLPSSLPTAPSNQGTIRNGDIMLYGSRTLVLFYKTFSTSYSYTRIGTVDNPSELESALGAGSVTITFELQ